MAARGPGTRPRNGEASGSNGFASKIKGERADRAALARRTGHLIRIVFNDQWQELRREELLTELHQRIRDVAEGPDGLLYVVTAEDDGAVLRLEPLPDSAD